MGMSASLKKATNKTNLKHNNREQEKYNNKEIDINRIKYNKYLVQENIKELYQREFGESLQKYNDKQKRKDRKIKNYYEHIVSGKKTSPQQEIIIQVGKGFRGEDYEFNDENWNKVNEILEKYFQEFEKRNPNLKVYNAVIHNDETSPHLHINFVPVADGYKRGLEKQVAFDKAIKQQNQKFDVAKPFEIWRENEMNEIERLMNQRGIERKLVGTNEYEDTNELKEVTEKLRELKIQVENELKKLDELTEKPKKSADGIQPIVVDPDDEPMPVVEMKKGFTGKHTVEPEDVKKLQDYAVRQKKRTDDLQGELKKRNENYKKLRKAYLNDFQMIDRLVDDKMTSERQKWGQERFKLNKQVNTLWNGLETLESENKALRRENGILQKWKDKAVEFMKNTKMYERFENMIARKNKNRNHDLEL